MSRWPPWSAGRPVRCHRRPGRHPAAAHRGRSCSSTSRTPASTVSPAPSSSAPTSGPPCGSPGVGRRRQLGPDLSPSSGTAHAAALVRRSRPDPRRPARHARASPTSIHNGTDVWMWSSQDKTATHLTLPAAQPRGHDAPPGRDRRPAPQQAADLALKAICPTTAVTTSGAARCRRPLGLRAGAAARGHAPRSSASVRHRHRRRAARAAAGAGLRQGRRRAGLRGRLHRGRLHAGRTLRSSPSTRRPAPRSPSRTLPGRPGRRQTGMAPPTPKPTVDGSR